MLTRGRLRSLQINMEDFTKHFLNALEDPDIVHRFGLLMQTSNKAYFDPIVNSLKGTIKNLQQTVGVLQTTIVKKDEEIGSLRREVRELRSYQDDLEQHSRRASIRVFGIPENVTGTTDDLLLQLFNSRLKLRPPLTLEEIEISHRVGKLQVEHQETEDGEGGTLVKPRPIIAKFVSRRTKARVMAARKHLKPKARQDTISPDAEPVDDEVNHDDEEDPNQVPLPQTIYIADDLTRNRAKIAFRARQLKRGGKLRDTWVFYCSVMIKDNTGKVSKVTSINELNIYWIRSHSYPMFVSPNYRHSSWHNKYDVLLHFMQSTSKSVKYIPRRMYFINFVHYRELRIYSDDVLGVSGLRKIWYIKILNCIFL